MNVQYIIFAVLFIVVCAAILRLGAKAVKQWQSPRKQYEAQMEDIQRRKKELGIDDD